MPTLNQKLLAAKQYLGQNWVLAAGSTYNIKKREPYGVCDTLRTTVLVAMAKGRL